MFSSGDSGYEDPAVEDPGLRPDPGRLSDLEPVGDLGRRHQPRDRAAQQLGVGDPVGHAARPAGGERHCRGRTRLRPAYNANTYDGSGGGGVSTAYTQPWYQRGVVPYSLATDVPEGSTTTPMRVVPDVSALADPSTGMLVGRDHAPAERDRRTRSRSAGSAAPASRARRSPASRPTPSRPPGDDIGFANPAIYARFGTSAFHDVTESPSGQYEVRNNYTDPYTATGPLVTYLRAMGIDGGGSPRRQRGVAGDAAATTTRPASAHPTGTSSRSSAAGADLTDVRP